MPVDAQLLESAIKEASGGDTEIESLLRDKFSKNESAAVAFTGGFTRTRDYTSKTQALAEDRRKVEGQLGQYQAALEAAEAEKAKVMKDLANQKVTAAGAMARLQSLKETYQLSDDDIPPMGDLIDTRKTGRVVDSTPDIDERLNAFEQRVLKEVSDRLIPELGSMTDLDIIWANMRDEHRELTGKRLTAEEQRSILAEARKEGKPLISVWENKYQIADARKKVERESWEKDARSRWDAEQTAKRSQEAMEGIRPGAADQTGLRLSPVLKREFRERGTDPVEPGEARPETPSRDRLAPSAIERESLTGAERAAKRFLERRAAGIPMGGKDTPVAKTA